MLLHCSTNGFKKELTPQKITQKILKLAEYLTEVRDMSWFLKLIIEVKILILQCRSEFLSEKKTRKNVNYIDNGNIALGMLNRSKLHLNIFGTIQLVKNYCEI